MTDSFATLVAYTRWADTALLTACAGLTASQYTLELGGSFPSLQATVAHMAGAAKVWSQRIAGEPTRGLPPVSEIPDVATALARLAEAYAVFERVAAEWEETKNDPFVYRNLAGVETTRIRWQVFRHIVNHGSYHRGQIANMLRQLGVKPPTTDLLFWNGD